MTSLRLPAVHWDAPGAVEGFKFLKAEHVPLITERETLRLSSARLVRSMESMGAGYGDAAELASLWGPGQAMEIGADHPLARRMGIPADSPVKIVLQAETKFNFYSDAFLFCVSGRRTPEIISRMRDEFEYDVSFRIPDLNALMARICFGVFGFRNATAGLVTYRDFDERSEEVFERNCLHKDTRFGWQEEIRCVFDSCLNDDALTVSVPGLEAYVCDWMRH